VYGSSRADKDEKERRLNTAVLMMGVIKFLSQELTDDTYAKKPDDAHTMFKAYYTAERTELRNMLIKYLSKTG